MAAVGFNYCSQIKAKYFLSILKYVCVAWLKLVSTTLLGLDFVNFFNCISYKKTVYNINKCLREDSY